MQLSGRRRLATRALFKRFHRATRMTELILAAPERLARVFIQHDVRGECSRISPSSSKRVERAISKH